MAEVVVRVDVAAPVQAIWDKLVDWPSHRQWMALTRVEQLTEQSEGLGVRMLAVTGIGRLAVRDPMTVTVWQPPPTTIARCGVIHTGRFVRGVAAFEVEAVADGSRVVWSEWLQLPFGLAGQVGWLAVRPVAAIFLRFSLRRLAKLVEASAR